MIYDLGFIDETGVLENDPKQRFFAIGLLQCNNISALSSELRVIKNKAEGTLRTGRFEYKFNRITSNNSQFYKDLLDLYFRFKDLRFSCVVLDKQNPKIDIEKAYGSSWEAHIFYSKLLIEENIKSPSQITILADYKDKPKQSSKYYESEINELPIVLNSCMLESHASIFIQLVDILVGCVVLDFKINRQPDMRRHEHKTKICDYIKSRLDVPKLDHDLVVERPNYFRVWEYLPK